jgi:hypothetical protein
MLDSAGAGNIARLVRLRAGRAVIGMPDNCLSEYI